MATFLYNPQPQAIYYALVAVELSTEKLGDLVEFEMPQGRLARMKHIGSPQFLGKTAQRLLFEWLPSMNESPRENMELCVLPPQYDRTDPEAAFDYCVFV